LKTDNAFLALDAARELKHMTLEDALGLCLVLRADARPYERATGRWLARYQAEGEAVTLADIRVIADLLAALPVHGKPAADDLATQLEARGLHRCGRRVRDMMDKPPERSTA
jgi:hypothetical protein